MAVNSFNTRTGDVTLVVADVTSALTFVPESSTNKNSSIPLSTSTVLFPAEKIVKDYVDNAIQDATVQYNNDYTY